MIASINTVFNEFYFYKNVNPFEENRGEEEQVDYDFLYNQKHIIERKEDSNRNYDDDDDDDLESVGKNDLYHYHFGDYYESINNIEIQKEVMESIRQQETFEFENDTSENRKRLYESEDEEYNEYHDDEEYDYEKENSFTQFGDIFTFTLRTNPETKEKCFDTIEYGQDTFLSYSLAIHVVTTKSFFPSLLSIHSWILSRRLFLLVSMAV